MERILPRSEVSKQHLLFFRLNSQPVCINNSLNLTFGFPTTPHKIYLSYMPHDVESWQILREKEDFVIYQSNNVGSTITPFVSFPASDALIRRKTDDSARL